jgi:hypothetical protein
LDVMIMEPDWTMLASDTCEQFMPARNGPCNFMSVLIDQDIFARGCQISDYHQDSLDFMVYSLQNDPRQSSETDWNGYHPAYNSTEAGAPLRRLLINAFCVGRTDINSSKTRSGTCPETLPWSSGSAVRAAELCRLLCRMLAHTTSTLLVSRRGLVIRVFFRTRGGRTRAIKNC